MGEAKRKAMAFVAEISAAEMACRIFEHMSGVQGNGAGRPYPTSPEKSMEALREMDPDVHARVMAATLAVMDYWRECIDKGQVPS